MYAELINSKDIAVHRGMQLFVIIFPSCEYVESLGVTFPPHDSSDAGSNPAEVVEFLRTKEFREQVLHR
jgi:hypothetical protein